MPSFSFFLIFVSTFISIIVPAFVRAAPELASVCDITSGADLIGLAIDKTDASPLYCEYHFHEYKEGTIKYSTVKYIDTNDQEMAEKQLEYTFSPLVPNVIQQDTRQGELRVLKYSAEGDHFLLEYKQDDATDKKSAIVAANEATLPLVADAGFDRLLKENWDVLDQGKTVAFSFLSPIHTRIIALTVKRYNRDSCGGITFDAESSICFTVNPKSSLLKLFAKPLYLLYDRSSQQVVVFSGVVNLVDAKGKPKAANIYYWHSQ